MISDRDKEFKEQRQNAALEYEYIIGTLWGMKPNNFAERLDGLVRGTAKGYADADWWRDSEDSKKIRDIDIGFLLGFRAIIHQLRYLNYRIEELERKLAK
jgi:hypothetical protein